VGEASCIVGALGWEDVVDLVDDIVSLRSAARVLLMVCIIGKHE
jgi:hypothetical protein